MNNTQTQTTLATVVAFVAGILAGKFQFFDAETWTAVLTGLAGVAIAVYNGYLTRKTGIVNQAGNFSGTTVVTTPDVAKALPNNDSVVANTEAKVVPVPNK